MKQTTQSQTERSLLAYAISKLRPDAFLHPVWIRFSHKDQFISPETIQDLFCEAEQLEDDHPSDACQVLLVCAACQNYFGQRNNALRTIQKTLALAERAGLAKETLWTMWGACAICVQQRDFEKAALYFERLRAVLNEQNEWMLANYVDILKQTLPQLLMAATDHQFPLPRDAPAGDLLILTLNWLQQWGFWNQPSQTGIGTISLDSTSKVTTRSSLPSFFSIQHWQDRWRTLMPAKQEGSRLQGTAENPFQNERRSAFWKSILRSPGKLPMSGTTEPQLPGDALQATDTPLLRPIPAEEGPAPDILFAHQKSVSKCETDVTDKLSSEATHLIPLTVHMLGAFRLTLGDSTIKLAASRGLSILKYLILHHRQGSPREVLMEIFWPDSALEAARNKLNVTMHSLRQALHSVTDLEVICFENGAYGFADYLQILLDVEQFEHCIKEGQQLESQNQLAAAVTEYENAVNQYQGDFLVDTPYESWTVLDRERLRIAYLDTLAHLSQIYFNQEQYAACVTACQLILARDLCREDAHYRLMQCYSRLGQGPLALRQYQICVEALQAELQVDPAPETTRLYEQIHRREQI